MPRTSLGLGFNAFSRSALNPTKQRGSWRTSTQEGTPTVWTAEGLEKQHDPWRGREGFAPRVGVWSSEQRRGSGQCLWPEYSGSSCKHFLLQLRWYLQDRGLHNTAGCNRECEAMTHDCHMCKRNKGVCTISKRIRLQPHSPHLSIYTAQAMFRNRLYIVHLDECRQHHHPQGLGI